MSRDTNIEKIADTLLRAEIKIAEIREVKIEDINFIFTLTSTAITPNLRDNHVV